MARTAELGFAIDVAHPYHPKADAGSDAARPFEGQFAGIDGRELGHLADFRSVGIDEYDAALDRLVQAARAARPLLRGARNLFGPGYFAPRLGRPMVGLAHEIG